jgi:hypothetical protein
VIQNSPYGDPSKQVSLRRRKTARR